MAHLERLQRWAAADPIHAALTIGFGSAFLSYTLNLAQHALDASAPVYALLAICLLGIAATAQSQRCARMVVWLSTNHVDGR